MIPWPAVSPRRLSIVAFVAACGPPVEQPPAPVAAPPVATPDPTPPPVPEASPTLPAPEPPPPELPPETTPAPGARKWNLAAIREGRLALHAMADGSIAVRGDYTFAIAPPRTGALRRERAWSHGLALDETERSATEVLTFGGRWPDLAFMTLHSESSRVAALYTVMRWQGGAWMPDKAPAQPGLIPFYAAYVGTPEGPVAGLRSFAAEETEYDPDEPPPKPPSSRPVLDRLTAEGRADGPWPALPAGPAGSDALALANGDLIVMRSGPVIQHWVAGSKAWKKLPAVGYTATGYYDSPVIAGRDPTRIYLASCPDTADDTPPRFHMFDGTRWVRRAPPDRHCVRSISEADDGTLWIVADGALYRDEPGGRQLWEPIPLPTLTLPARPAAWRPGQYGEAWREYPAEPPGQPRLIPEQVLAFGTDDIWVVANGDPQRFHDPGLRAVALTTRAIKAPLLLPDDDLAALEASALEPEVVPTSRETACHEVVLDLGETTDAPADVRPPALAAALAADATDLRRLSVVAVDLGGRHGVQALWLADSPDPTESYSLLSGLAERLRGEHPRVRLLCRVPIVTRVLP